MPVEAPPDITDDAVLGGRLRLLQPRRGHRFGHDAILLAAATPARGHDRVVDLGAGVGAAGLALAWRVPGAKVTLVEIDTGLAALATANAARNQLADRVDVIALDVAAAVAEFDAAGLGAGSCDVVLMNPPFYDPGRHHASPDAGRRRAHMVGGETLPVWIGTAARLLRPSGVLTVIYRADGVGELLAGLDRDFGAARLAPVYPKPDAPAVRILVTAIKASRAPSAILPGLVLAERDGDPRADAEVILRHGEALPSAAVR